MDLLLAAGVQAAKVVNDSALHVRVINTPLPVHVTDGPDIWSEVGTVGAIAAAVIALITLFAVLRQIGLAKQQIGLADTQIKQVDVQIKLAQEELEAVKTDLANNTAQFKEFMRRPELRASFAFVAQQRETTTGGPYFDIAVIPSVENVGGRAVGSSLLEILVPINEFRNHVPASEQRQDGSTMYAVVAFPETGRLYANGLSVRLESKRIQLKAGARLVPVLWRIYDDYGSYPAEDYGIDSFAVPAEE